ncbi:hypothetical protein B0H11DRAFT_1924195 [Mycena galericulata]|nr:hypothetical protein B0H11DRAFT_1924195 [Mycena galericulata]
MSRGASESKLLDHDYQKPPSQDPGYLSTSHQSVGPLIHTPNAPETLFHIVKTSQYGHKNIYCVSCGQKKCKSFDTGRQGNDGIKDHPSVNFGLRSVDFLDLDRPKCLPEGPLKITQLFQRPPHKPFTLEQLLMELMATEESDEELDDRELEGWGLSMLKYPVLTVWVPKRAEKKLVLSP